MIEKPKIYVFSSADGREGACFAMAEDGTVLGSHWCSSQNFALHDLGVIKGSRPDRHDHYRQHYPGGYEMEFIPADQLESHAGFQKAFKLNKLSAPVDREEVK